MKIEELCDVVCPLTRVQAVEELLKGDKTGKKVIDGLAGSMSAVLFSRFPKRKSPYLIICSY